MADGPRPRLLILQIFHNVVITADFHVISEKIPTLGRTCPGKAKKKKTGI